MISPTSLRPVRTGSLWSLHPDLKDLARLTQFSKYDVVRGANTGHLDGKSPVCPLPLRPRGLKSRLGQTPSRLCCPSVRPRSSSISMATITTSNCTPKLHFMAVINALAPISCCSFLFPPPKLGISPVVPGRFARVQTHFPCRSEQQLRSRRRFRKHPQIK